MAIQGDTFVGTLKYLDSGSPAEYWGPGYFLAFKWDDVDDRATSLLVGLQPSAGSGMQEAIADADKNGYCKITNKNEQTLVFKQSCEGHVRTQKYKLNGLTLAPQS